MSTTLTENLARTHEALYPRLETLARQVEAIAARKPEAEVPPETRTAAEALLFESQKFGTRSRRSRRGLEPAPDTYAPLATALGQALAGLDAFETRHSGWSEKHQCFVWLLPRGVLKPVARLKPHANVAAGPESDKRAAFMRAEIIRRIQAKYDEGYDAAMEAMGRSGGSTDPA